VLAGAIVARRYFDDIEVGYRSRVGSWKLEPDEIIAFAKQWDPQPFHTDLVAAEASIYGGLTASSLHLFAICTLLFFEHEDQIAVLAMLGKDGVRFPNPARAGETLYYDTECIERRPSASKPDRGVIRLRDTVTDRSGQTTMTQEVSLMVARRPGAS
jgi:acyl dehydratase